MEKVLIASFDREEEQDFEELVLFLKEKGAGKHSCFHNAFVVICFIDLNHIR